MRYEASFLDVVAEQLRMAPYLLLSLVVHAVVAFLLAALIFLERIDRTPPTIQIVASYSEEEEEGIFDQVEEPIEEPRLIETPSGEEDQQHFTPLDQISDFDPGPVFDHNSWGMPELSGANGGGKYGMRGSNRGGGMADGSVAEALKWLADHQDPRGYWDCDRFNRYDKFLNEKSSTGAGNPYCDVGVTALALLAFLGQNNSPSAGQYRDVVARGISWLKNNQREDGLFGEEIGYPTIYNHALATMAMGEAYYLTRRSPLLRRPLDRAVRLILRARNRHSVWRYRLRPDGQNDTSVTGWMILALKTAEDGGIPIPEEVYDDTIDWLDEVTHRREGHTGYRRLGDSVHEDGEALTAVSLLCRMFISDVGSARSWKNHPNYRLLKKQADRCLEELPQWRRRVGEVNLYYWYYASFALNQFGGEIWDQWRKALERALVPNQRTDGNFRGSWDPVGPWGRMGGRVYSTALCTLMLEAHYRYAPLLGSR